jgi:hypothetical protein
MKLTATTTSIKKPTPKMSQGVNEVTWNDINAVLTAIKNGDVVSDLALSRAGYNRAQVDALYAAVTRQTGVCKRPVESAWVSPGARCLTRD